jgi:hypothetical protein
MSAQRRDFLKQLFATGALPALLSRRGAFGALLDPQAAKQVNPDFSTKWKHPNDSTVPAASGNVGPVRSAEISRP